MEISQTISTTAISGRKYTLFILIYLLASISLVLFLGFISGKPYVGVIGLAVFLFMPVIFQKKFQKKFSQNANIYFHDESVAVELSDIDTGHCIRKEVYKYKEMQSIRAVISSKNSYAFLKFTFRNGSKASYTLKDQLNEDPNNISNIVTKQISTYNTKVPEKERIKV